ncbi:MAG: hypothetical protein AAGJ38_01020 [Planctomycetota bacterium]
MSDPTPISPPSENDQWVADAGRLILLGYEVPPPLIQGRAIAPDGQVFTALAADPVSVMRSLRNLVETHERERTEGGKDAN